MRMTTPDEGTCEFDGKSPRTSYREAQAQGNTLSAGRNVTSLPLLVSPWQWDA